MKRREFIAGLGSATAWPLVARAQQPALPVVGFLSAGSPTNSIFGPFKGGLAEVGYVEGRNYAVEARWAEGRYERLPDLAAELIRRHASVILAVPAAAALAAKRATTTTPIVFASGFDPVRIGLVASYNRPGGNVTGVTYLTNEISEKRLDLLRQLAPSAKRIAVVVNPSNPGLQSDATDMMALQAAARVMGRELVVFKASTVSDLDTAFASLARQGAEAIIVGADPFFYSESARIAALAARSALPAMYEARIYAEDGGLMSYGPDIDDQGRIAGVYAGRILRGDKPADLPVIQPTKLELVINLKTAKALGFEIPPVVLALADKVIE
jgi:putative ABC transport system substrate-binding protein